MTKAFFDNLSKGGLYEVFVTSAISVGSLIMLCLTCCLLRYIIQCSNCCTLICSKCRLPPGPPSCCSVFRRRTSVDSMPGLTSSSGSDSSDQEQDDASGISLRTLGRLQSRNMFLQPRQPRFTVAPSFVPVAEAPVAGQVNVVDIPRPYFSYLTSWNPRERPVQRRLPLQLLPSTRVPNPTQEIT